MTRSEIAGAEAVDGALPGPMEAAGVKVEGGA